MEDRDRDKMNQDESSSPGKKDDSKSSFGQDIGRSEDWDSEASRRSGEQTDPSPGRRGGSKFDVEH
jgi:hypothetical protein